MFRRLLAVQAIWTGLIAFLCWTYLGVDVFVDWFKFIIVASMIIGTMYFYSYEREEN